jgi:hypothetical protein
VAAALRRLMAGEIKPSGTGLEGFAWPVLAERFEEEIERAVAAMP